MSVVDSCMQDAGGEEALAAQQKSVKGACVNIRDGGALRRAMLGCDAVVHTAGPYLGEQPTVLKARLRTGQDVQLFILRPRCRRIPSGCLDC